MHFEKLVQDTEIKAKVNPIFTINGHTEPKDFHVEFADGCRIVDFYNLLFSDNEVVGIVRDYNLNDRKRNWAKVNGKCSFLYLIVCF